MSTNVNNSWEGSVTGDQTQNGELFGQLDGISQNHHTACDVLENMNLAVEKNECIQGFSPLLSWSHYRTLTKVENKSERLFYELETGKEGWSALKIKEGQLS